MCGITGYIDYNNSSSKEILQNMLDVIRHRGPDDSGLQINTAGEAAIGLAHSRLSILDLSTNGHQPMSFEQYQVVYNGEIYNFKAIRDQLKNLGYQFTTECDTEVLLKAFHKWQFKAIDKFIGMFAFAIYDKQQNKLSLIRDRAGVKPLYYYWDGQTFLFGSELKSFHQNKNFKKAVNSDAVALYFKYGYIPQPHCIFNNTFKVEAGSYLVFDINTKSLKKQIYWDASIFYTQPKLEISDEEAIQQADNLLSDAIQHRLVSDVPVGVFLSGGYDSSLVTAIAQKSSNTKINSFTIGFAEKKYDESKVAKQIAKHIGTNHTEYICTSSDLKQEIANLPYVYDEPFGDSSALPTMIVAGIAKKTVGVSLSADAGDELFAGYNKHTTVLKYYKYIQAMPLSLRPLIIKLLKLSPTLPFIYNIHTRKEKIIELLKYSSVSEYLAITSQLNSNNWIDQLLLQQVQKLDTRFNNQQKKFNSSLDEILAIDYQTYLPDDILVKVDRASMKHSLEAREPLLDHRLLEFVARLPDTMKIRDGNKKWLLKQIAYNYIPKELLDRPKKGFSIPLERWLQEPELKQLIHLHLSRQEVEKYGVLNYAVVKQLLVDFEKGINFSIRKLWLLLSFQMWCYKWLN